MNLILQTDSYKLSHYRQYPPGTKTIYSYLESRGGVYNETVFFGLQYYLKRYLAGKAFTAWDIDDAYDIAAEHFGNPSLFNKAGWEKLFKKYGGYLPLSIKAVPEGSVIPVSNVLMTVENTDPEFPWLTNFVESLLLKVWYPTTVATLSREVKKIVKKYLEATGDVAGLPFKLHDFGYRGVSSEESAMIGGASHLVNFLGSDTLLAIDMIKQYYKSKEVISKSIPASEHSTITSWGMMYERKAYENMLEQYPTGLVACVSDSYDIFNACENLWGGELRDRVMKRDGVLIIRPDSGDPCPTILKVLDILGDKFGFTKNDKGFKVLDPHVRVIQGDGVNPSSIERILNTMQWRQWSADNIAFGMGGALLQKMDRDTQSFAFKCSAMEDEKGWHSVFKTATGKKSKKGKLFLGKHEDGTYETLTWAQYPLDRDPEISKKMEKELYGNDILQEVFRDGVILKETTLDKVRELASL